MSGESPFTRQHESVRHQLGSATAPSFWYAACNAFTLLCVDDDLGILEFYETMLGSNGYHVLLAQDGRQALAVFQEKVKEIDAVISDYEMPGMNGIELAAELKRYNSSLPVIMISGCLPLLDNIRHNVDFLLSKGAPVEEILARIEFLLCLKREASAFSIS